MPQIVHAAILSFVNTKELSSKGGDGQLIDEMTIEPAHENLFSCE